MTDTLILVALRTDQQLIAQRLSAVLALCQPTVLSRAVPAEVRSVELPPADRDVDLLGELIGRDCVDRLLREPT